MDAFKRLFEATGCHTQNQLAHLIGVRQSSISDAMRRNSIPAAWLVALVRTRGISPEWIITGNGSKYLTPTDESPLTALPLPNNFRPLHGLRHVFASLGVSNGVPLSVMQRLLTHASPQMTNRYAHLADEALKNAAANVGALILKTDEHSVN